jgi:hypothetical protein
MFLFGAGTIKMRNYMLIRDIPRSKVRSLALGLVEIQGTARAAKPMKSPLSKSECVFCHWQTFEYRGGKAGGDSGWVIIGMGSKFIPFYAEDETGSVPVIPIGAEFQFLVRNLYLERGTGRPSAARAIATAGAAKFLSKMIKTKGVAETEAPQVDSDRLTPVDSESVFRNCELGDRRYEEYVIAPGDTIYVLGTAARAGKDDEQIIIRRGHNNRTFIIGEGKETEVLQKQKRDALLLFAVGALFIIVPLVVLVTR